jgi:hypothetical protein
MQTPGRSRIVPVDEQVALAFGPRLAVQVWKKDVTLSHLLVLGRELRAFIPECRGRRYASVCVIEPGISLRMSDEVRNTSEALQREFAPNIQCMVYVVTQEGFVAAAARTVASGFALVTRAPYPLKIMATPAEAASFVSTHIEMPPADVQRLVDEARATLR